MNEMQPVERSDKPKGASIWTVLIIALVLAVVGLGALAFTLHQVTSDKRKLQQQLEAQQNAAKLSELQVQKAGEEAKVLKARNQQEQVLTLVNSATNSLMQLLTQCDTLRADAAALLTNEAGRKVALHPGLVQMARRFYESSLPAIPAEPDLIARLESVRRIGLQVLTNRGTAYEPPADLGETAQKAGAWSVEGQAQVKPAHDVLAALVEDSQVKFTRATLTAESPTLAAAIDQLNKNEVSDSLRQADQILSVARTNAVATRVAAEAKKREEDARRDADETRHRSEEAQAAKEREWKEREAKLKVEATKTKVLVQDKADEARNVELRKKASDPNVQAKLAPFITPGYIGIYKPTYDKKPFSFSEMQSFGALAPTVEGLDRLVIVALAPTDKVRPHWKLNRKLYRRHTDELEMVKEVQQLLIELGPVLVEMGKLEP